MKKLKIGFKFLLTIMVIGSCIFTGKSVLADTQSDFIQRLEPIVKSVAKKYNLYASIMMAQAALESDWGQSQLAVQDNNYFGMKGSYNGQSVTLPTTEYNSNGQMYYTNANFKKYPSVYASVDDNGSLLRNGTNWDAKYYSGVLKENASTFQAAANALVGKYASSPQYATVLINLINQYNWSKLDQDISNIIKRVVKHGKTHHVSKKTTNANNNIKKSKVNKSHAVKKITYANVKYKYVNSESFSLDANYQNETLYRSIPNTKVQTTTSPWKNHNVSAGQNIYVDSIAYSNYKGNKNIWYRIRFRKNKRALKYWTDKSTFKLPQISYYKVNLSLLINHHDNEPIYNHVMGDQELASTISNTSKLNNNRYPANYMAIVNNHGDESIWYRIRLSKHRSGWGSGTYLFNNKQVQYISKQSLLTLNRNYAQYPLYEHIPGTRHRIKTFKWSSMGNNVQNDAINSDLMAIRNAYQSIWYRIELNNHDYWVSNQALNY